MRHSLNTFYIYGISVILLVLSAITLPLLDTQKPGDKVAIGSQEQIIDQNESITPILPTTNDAPAEQPSAGQAPAPQKVEVVSEDTFEKAKNFYSIRLAVLIASHSAQNAPIQPNQASWDAFINSIEDTPIDPQTNQPPKFTLSEPAVGEVHYVYPARCASAFEFSAAKSGYAFKTKIGSKRVCISNIYKYIEK